jgi:hypothetical protein
VEVVLPFLVKIIDLEALKGDDVDLFADANLDVDLDGESGTDDGFVVAVAIANADAAAAGVDMGLDLPFEVSAWCLAFAFRSTISLSVTLMDFFGVLVIAAGPLAAVGFLPFFSLALMLVFMAAFTD